MNEEKVVEKKDAKKRTEKSDVKFIACETNYSDKETNRTSVSYIVDKEKLSTFISGIYEGKLIIEYKGEIFSGSDILRIKKG